MIYTTYVMKEKLILTAIGVAAIVACHPISPSASTPGASLASAAVAALPAGYAPQSVAGKTIYVSADAYVFDAGGNSYAYETGRVTYTKTGANTARIVDTFAGFTTDIIFTSPTKGKSTDGDVVTIE